MPGTDSVGAVEVSVVIATCNRAEMLAHQLSSLTRQDWTGTWEVVVADNCVGVDDTRGVVDSFADRLPGLRLVDASARKGPSFARNAGVEASHGTSILFLDDDDEVNSAYVRAMASALRQNGFVAAWVDHEKLNPWGRGFRDEWQNGDVAYEFLPMVTSSAMGVRRDVFLYLGAFDEQMQTGEDIDFSWRVQMAGTPLVLVHEAVMFSRQRHELRALYRQARAWGVGDAALFLRYRDVGMRQVPGDARRTWARLAKRAVLARDRDDLAWCAGVFGHRVGRLVGSARERVLFP